MVLAENFSFNEGNAKDFRYFVDLMYSEEKWFVSYGDYDAYKTACENGSYHFVVCKNDQGKLVGCVSIAQLNSDLAFIDNFYTIPEYRGNGVGKRNFALALTDDIRIKCNVGLHSDVKVSEYYSKKQGFKNIRDIFVEVFHLTNFFDGMKRITSKSEFRVADAKKALKDVQKIDFAVWKKSRNCFLNAWICREDVKAVVIYKKDQPIGYGVIRPSCAKKEYILGPVYLTEEQAALRLLNALTKDLEYDAKVEIRSPSSNTERLCRIMKDIGNLERITKFITQFTKFSPDYCFDPVYCLTDTSVPV